MMYGGGMPVYMAVGATDMRKSIDGLALIVMETFDMDPFSKALYVFCNRNHTRLKILEWEMSGFWLHLKRLEKGRFKWPDGDGVKSISERELRWLLDGLDIGKTSGHKEVLERVII
jgi:transposase